MGPGLALPMSLNASNYALLDDLASRLAAESIFAAPGGDEGLVPSYSILTDILALLEFDGPLAKPLRALQAMLDTLLENARPWDEASAGKLKEVGAWLPGALAKERTGGDSVPSTPATPAATAAVAEAGEELLQILPVRQHCVLRVALLGFEIGLKLIDRLLSCHNRVNGEPAEMFRKAINQSGTK